MRRDSIKISPGFSDMSENLKGSGSDDKRIRAERRWRRRELNCYGSATRTTVKSRGNKPVVTDNNVHNVEDEVDEDNKIGLDTYVSLSNVDKDNHVDGSDEDNRVDGSDIDAKTGYNDIDVDKDNHVDGSDIDIDANTRYNNENDDYSDPDYKKFLENLRVEGKSYVYSVIVGNQHVHIRYEQDEEEENVDDEDGKEEGFTRRDETGNLGTAESDSIREQRGGSVDSQQNLETERGPCNIRSHSGVSRMPKNNCNMELDIDVDEDYQIMLNSELRDYDSDSLENVNLGTRGIDSIREQTSGPVEPLQSQETERGPCNIRSHSGVSRMPKNNCNMELDIDVDEDYQIMLNSELRDYDSDSLENVNLGTRGIDSIREQTSGPVEPLQSKETERGPCNQRWRSEVSCVQKNNCNSELDIDVDEDYQTFLNSYRAGCDSESWVPMGCKLIGKSLSIRRNSRTSDQAFDIPLVQSDYDEDYQLFLNSNLIIDGDSYMSDRNITNVESGSNSSDSDDLILLEPNQIGENTPFIPSKMFDSSCFENETNPRQFPACDQSQFRRRLMEYLEKPYDQQEYDDYLNEVHRKRPKDRHFETRQGVVKSYPTYGVNKSYLESHPDLEKAIAEFKEPHRVLFLLRGFIFWLKNLTYDHDGIFQPWHDESCLEVLRKM